jgi:lipopolysaccharide heptosyltransferase II
MFPHLRSIYDPRERWLVGLADAGLTALVRAGRLLGPSPRPRPVQRVLLLRLERIGDLLMSAGAIEAARATFPEARIDLVVGSWNAALAARFPWVDHVESLDAPWLARGTTPSTLRGMASRVREWRGRRYDLALNLEGDIRSNLLLAASGAPVRVGLAMAGGGPLLTASADFDPTRHTDEHGRRVVRAAARALDRAPVEPPPVWPRFTLPETASREAARLLGEAGRGGRPLVGVHASGGREIKQWHPDRFAAAASAVAAALGARVVLTGAPDDRPLVEAVRAAIRPDVDVLDVAGALDLLTLAAILSRLDLYVTGDTGPMHLAAAMGTPVVAVFGISDPARYAPLAPHRRIVRIDLPCSPCNRVRLPPARCRGHVPDCLDGIHADAVVRAALDLAEETSAPHRPQRRAGERS